MPDWKAAHRPGCTKPAPLEQATPDGSRMFRCPGCQRFWFPDSAPAHKRQSIREQAATATETQTALPIPASRYVCRDHYTPVRPDGRGCIRCARERAER